MADDLAQQPGGPSVDGVKGVGATNEQVLTVYRNEKSPLKIGEREALFFSTDRKVADFVQGNSITKGNVNSYEIRLKNPLTIEGDRYKLFDKFFGEGVGERVRFGEYDNVPGMTKIADSLGNNFDPTLVEEKVLIPLIKKAGYDGVILKEGQWSGSNEWAPEVWTFNAKTVTPLTSSLGPKLKK